MQSETRRDLLFVSHANPEDNTFAGWLALQLAREGYPVWCDLTELLGGEDFWRNIEPTIEERAVKFLYVLSRVSNHKEGTLQELAVAKGTARKHNLIDFVIPLQIDGLPHDETNIEIRRLISISFNKGWATGFDQLLKKLEQDKIAKSAAFGPSAVRTWWRSMFGNEATVQQKPESCISNIFPILSIPEKVRIHSVTATQEPEFAPEFPYPAIIRGDSLLSFAKAEELADSLGDRRIWHSRDESPSHVMSSKAGRDDIYILLRLAWEMALQKKGLEFYDLSAGRCFYFKLGQLQADRFAFSRPDGSPGYRSLVGYSTIRKWPSGEASKRYWHFGVRATPVIEGRLAYAIKSHVVFSTDGRNILMTPRRLASARRTQCKDWWNDDWRDRLLASMAWLRDGRDELRLPVSGDDFVVVAGTPDLFESPVSYQAPKVEKPHEEIIDEDEP